MPSHDATAIPTAVETDVAATLTPETITLIAWAVVLTLATIVYLAMVWRGHTTRTAFMTALIWAKIGAGVLLVLGYDKPVLTIVYASQEGGTASLTLTANTIILASLAITNLIVWRWDQIKAGLQEEAPQLAGLLTPPPEETTRRRRARR